METFLKNLKPGPPENDLEDESDEKIIARAFAQARTKRRNLATSEEGEEDGPTEEEILAQALDEARLEHSSSPTYPGIIRTRYPRLLSLLCPATHRKKRTQMMASMRKHDKN